MQFFIVLATETTESVLQQDEASLLKSSELACADKHNLIQNTHNFIRLCLDYNNAALILK